MFEKMKKEMDPGVFWPTFIMLIAVSAILSSSKDAGEKIVNKLFSFTTVNFGWLFLWSAMAIFAFLGWLAFSKYGKIKLGEGKPEFSTFSWIAMLFCAGLGSGIMYMGTIEWSYYILTPPFGIEAYSADAYKFAQSYALFHWGPHAWAMYCLPTIPIAYYYYVKKKPTIRMSVTCDEVLGDKVYGKLGKAIDVVTLFGLIGGCGAGLGLSTPMITAGISYLTGIPESFELKIAVIVVWVMIFSFSVWRGLKKGIKLLSDINVYLAFSIIIFIFVLGPTTFILDNFTNSIGVMFKNFMEMSFYTDPIQKSGFPQGWTVFYWAWWVALGPFVGLFTAKISKGRTIKEVILGVVCFGTLGGWMFHAVLGNYAIDLQVTGALDLVKITAEQGSAAAIIAAIGALPLGKVVLVVFISTAFIFFATSLDSAAYTTALVCSKDLSDDKEPCRMHRMTWAFSMAVLPLVLIFIGGLQPLQTTVIVTGLPIVFVYILMAVSLSKSLKKDYGTLVNCNMLENEAAN
ncbi:betaine/carnitine transporter, BCCT family [Dethiosulfatibacter aminovorans DSM 17477]|uniref:Betaine/carnitine transporter, BCCT family n=1 Tax=Dethiosulfatibacter aminovorans DSM 17477 TaxID=1121476 RepID=A0A1M6M462_9FIRM|nr:BCCT family transporter [Dethiosulfatibacter aminovorans]SHJ78288.1 betaine/carnitine transporter, BCCT family [Dethiosulfatibacter aminovorans DSM 17477]